MRRWDLESAPGSSDPHVFQRDGSWILKSRKKQKRKGGTASFLHLTSAFLTLFPLITHQSPKLSGAQVFPPKINRKQIILTNCRTRTLYIPIITACIVCQNLSLGFFLPKKDYHKCPKPQILKQPGSPVRGCFLPEIELSLMSYHSECFLYSCTFLLKAIMVTLTADIKTTVPFVTAI